MRILLEHLYDTYKKDSHPMDAKTPAGTDAMKSIFLQAIQNMTPADQRAVVTEIESFFSGTYPCLDGDALKWWKVHMTPCTYVNTVLTAVAYTGSCS